RIISGYLNFLEDCAKGLRICVLWLVVWSFYAIAIEGPSCSIFIHCATSISSLQSDKYPKTNPVLEREGYSPLYDGRSKTALWVYEELTRDSLKGSANRDQIRSTQDPNIPEIIQSDLKDYKGSGFDRGHLAPAGDHKASEAQMEETFYLSNISPQVPDFNRGYWRAFEIYIRALTNEFDVVRVITGPLYLPHEEPDGKKYVTYQVIGDNNVAVPTHFFKLITLKKGSFKEHRAYIMPNEKIDKDTPFECFQTTVSKVEKVAGIIFQR
ncbi:MAG: DNA/RNA non-specific endonuclease, partial [Chlamydiales bacterium]